MNEAAQTALNQVSALIVVLDFDGRVVWWNRAYRELMGFEDSRLPIEHFTELVAPEDRAATQRAFEEQPRDGVASYEAPLVTKTGERRWVAWSTHLIDQDGQPLLLSTGIDRTAERDAFVQLKASSEQMLELMCAAADAIIWCDNEWRITFFNRAAEEMWGVPASAVIGQSVEILVPAEHRAIALDMLRRFARQEARSLKLGAAEDVRGKRTDGSEFYGDLTIVKVPAGAGWRFLIATRDITTRKRMEQEKQFFSDVGRIISQSHERDEILGAVAVLAASTVADCCLIDIVNEQGVERVAVAHGNSEMAWIADELRHVRIFYDSQHPICVAISTGHPWPVPRVEDAHLHEMSQSPRHLELLEALKPRSLLVVPFYTRGALFGVLLLFSETIDRYGEGSLPFAEEIGRRLGLALENARLYRALEEALRSRDDVLGIVAHDLRSPLSAIQMAARGLVPQLAEGERGQRLLEVIQRSSTRMSSLIADLLDIASMEAGQVRLKRRTQDARELLNEALIGARALAEGAGVDLHVSAPEEPVLLHADKLRCAQILTNLLANAVKFTPRGGRVDVTLERHRQHAIFVVRDTGPGLSPEAKKHLFEPFWQRRRSTGEGVGLGLAIARGLVLAHGGDISVESEVGKGSSFWFRLPLATAANGAEQVQEITPLGPRPR